LDLHPETVVRDGVSYQRRDLLNWGPASCFYKDDLYTLRFGRTATDEMEKLFFGEIDRLGHAAVTEIAEFAGISKSSGPDAFRNLPAYMGAQRFRTPRGLDELKKRASWEAHSHNATLVALAGVFQAYATMWVEGVWEIVRARRSPTKFIATDDPVTFYCKVMFPSEWNYPKDCNLKQVGTRTMFPLGLDSCLIITHLQLTRHPKGTPTEHRENARYYDQTMMHLGSIQFGRELEEDEVLRINYILKKRATRYIAAAEKEWLYPERRVSTTDWKLLDEDWFLLPHLWKIPFSGGIMAGGDGWAWAADEYGRHPGNPQYQNKRMHEIDWIRHQLAEREWARKRVGKSVAHIDEFWHDSDGLMLKYLQEEGLMPD
jgi:hypothetical protein